MKITPTLVFVCAALLLMLVMLGMLDNDQTTAMPEVTYSDFKNDVTDKKIDQVEINGATLSVKTKEGLTYRVTTTGNSALPDLLSENDIRVRIIPLEKPSTLYSLFISAFPILLLIGVWIYFMRNMQGRGGGLNGFGQSKAKLLTQSTNKVTFNDVAGCDEAKQEVEEIVSFLRDPNKFCRLGGRIPKGVLMVGSPGTGKTLLARAIAGEANVPFFSISGSDFVEMFVGVGAARVRDMFTQAKKNAPCIIFIDEIDAVGRHRGAGLGGGNDEREQTLNSILVEMDGFEANEGVIIIAATNRPDVLDPALLRPGRFDRQVVIPIPDLIGREQILRVHLKKIVLNPAWTDHDTRTVARKTPGMSGADLANLCNEAALMAGRANRKFVVMSDFETASDKIIMGTERRNTAMTDDDKKRIAYHEAGHAIVGLNCEYHDPLHKVTIIPRGRALGVTMNLPVRDRWLWTKQELSDKLAVLYGGRIAEILIFGEDHVTTGASNDIQQATNLARAMVKEYGMGEKTGRIRYSSNQQEVFLGKSFSQSTDISQKYAELVDDEVLHMLQQAEKRAEQILESKRENLDKLAEALLIYETLDGSDVGKLLAGEDISKPDIVSEDEVKEIKESLRKSSVPVTTLKK